VGPRNVTGVIRALAAHPTLPEVLYAAAQFGGVFKTDNGGNEWIPLMDHIVDPLIDALALCRAVPDTVYAGKSDLSGPYSLLFRTLDGGRNWQEMTPRRGHIVAALAVHPTDSNKVYLANSDGLHRSRDGGVTWDPILYEAPLYDVKLNPIHPEVVFLSGMSGVFRSDDGGDTWHRIGATFAFKVRNDDKGEVIDARLDGRFRTLLGVGGQAGLNGRFLVIKVQGTVITSNGGHSEFRVLSQDFGWDNQNYWCSCLAVSPIDEGLVIAGGNSVQFMRDAKRLDHNYVEDISDSLHQDQQSIEFRPDGRSFYFANDGAVGLSNGYAAAKISDGLVATQCVNVSVSQTADPTFASATFHTGTILSRLGDQDVWDQIDGPELGLVEIDPQNPNVIFSSCGSPAVNSKPRALQRSEDRGKTWTQVFGGHVDRFLSINPDDSKFILTAGPTLGEVFISSDNGKTWFVEHDASGMPFNLDNEGLIACEWGCAPFNAFVGTVSGRLWRYVPSLGSSWFEIATPLGPRISTFRSSWRGIYAIGAHPSHPVLYIGYGGTEPQPLWRSNEHLQFVPQPAWSSASGSDPAHSLPSTPVAKIIVDPWNPLRVFVAMLLGGIFVSEDQGETWRHISRGLPNVEINDMRLHIPSRTLVVATWGRGIFRSRFDLDQPIWQ
jgi:photosystem II stability/assembly factor-like uncharacterized protein